MARFILSPDTRISYWDSTALRGSRYDAQAGKGKGTRLGWYTGYKLHLILSSDAIPLAWDITSANVYDNQCSTLLEDIPNFDVFMVLADSAYDDQKLFKKSEEQGFRLVTDVNIRNARSLKVIKDPYRRENIWYRTGKLGQKMMKNRTAIERFFATLKIQYHVENPRLFGEKRYRRHIKWVLLAYLCDRLNDKENGITSAKAPWNR